MADRHAESGLISTFIYYSASEILSESPTGEKFNKLKQIIQINTQDPEGQK